MAYEQRTDVHETDILLTLGNITACYTLLDRPEAALDLGRKIYARKCALSHLLDTESIFITAANLANQLNALGRFGECISFAVEIITDAMRALGPEHGLTMTIQNIYANALCNCPDATLRDMQLAVVTMEGCVQTSNRVMGKTHPRTLESERFLDFARMKLAAEEARTGLAAL